MARTKTGLSAEKLKELARAGAEHTLNQLRAEIIAIERTFPELALSKRRKALRSAVNDAGTRTRKMSAVDLIRFGGHLPKGGYDVHNGGNEQGPATAPAVHG